MLANAGCAASLADMCNLYNISTNQEALRALVSSFDDLLGNLEPSIDVWPDRTAPIIRNGLSGRREAIRTRWGMPSSSFALMQATQKRADKLKAKGIPFDFKELLRMEPDKGTTNVRNMSSRHWARWLGVEHRCVVPVTSFAEPDPASRLDGGPTPNAWFALDAIRPLMFFAGLWVPGWESVRKVKDGPTKDDLFAFLTTEPNDVVGAVHSKAMPVLVTTVDEVEHWLTAPWEDAKTLQRPLPDGMLEIVPRPPSPEA